jgi:hypothetical protein
MISTIKQHALPSGSLVIGKATHQGSSPVDVVPLAAIGESDVIFFTNRGEQVLQVDLFDEHLDIDRDPVPKAHWRVGQRGALGVADDPFRLGLDVPAVEVFKTIGSPLVVDGADVERQMSVLAALIDQPLRRVQIALGDGAGSGLPPSPALGETCERCLSTLAMAASRACLAWNFHPWR